MRLVPSRRGLSTVFAIYAILGFVAGFVAERLTK